jgi:hypothetical protein
MTATKKTKTRNYYKSGKFKNANWQASVTNDESKQRATLVFTKDFNQAANDLKAVKTKINKELNNVTKQIKRIKKDSKTGDLLKNSLTSQLNAYETARKDFLSDISKLYNGAIREYNEWLQSVYDELSKTQITNQGSATTVQAENISADDSNDLEA